MGEGYKVHLKKINRAKKRIFWYVRDKNCTRKKRDRARKCII
jgi:hypothetical protein